MFLQETHSTKSCESRWKNEWGGKIWFDHDTSSSKGVAILINPKFELKSIEVIRMEEFPGRCVALKATMDREEFLLCNLYCPNEDSPISFEKVFKRIDQTGCDRKIIGGDFNVVIGEKDRRGTGKHHNRKAAKTVNNLILQHDLIDIWRAKKGEEPGFTWRKLRPKPVFERLDLFLVAMSVEQLVNKIEIIPAFRSDHSIVKMEIAEKLPSHGRGYWKFNTSLLHDKDYIDKINQLIEIQLAQIPSYQSILDWWELFKIAVAGTTIQYASRKKKASENKLQVLEKKLKYWEKEQDEVIGIFPKIEEHVAELRKEIAELYTYKTQGAVLRCQIKWAESGEKPTKMFLNMEKARFNKKTILRLNDRNGRLISNEHEILKHINEFYQHLYKAPNPNTFDSQTYLSEIEEAIPKVNTEQYEQLEAEISENELSRAVFELKNQKAPGVDGIPIDFYKIFWAKLKSPFHKVVLQIFRDQKVHLTARRGLISLLEKNRKKPFRNSRMASNFTFMRGL